MEKDIKKTFEDIRKIKLSNEKRLEMRAFLESEMGMASGEVSFWNFFLTKRFALFFLLLLSVSFSGVSLAAEKSLPGDFLYPIKIGSNEKIVDFLKFSDKSKDEWEERKIERRMDEYNNLRDRGQLTEESSQKIKEQLDSYHIGRETEPGDNYEGNESKDNGQHNNEKIEDEISGYEDGYDEYEGYDVDKSIGDSEDVYYNKGDEYEAFKESGDNEKEDRAESETSKPEEDKEDSSDSDEDGEDKKVESEELEEDEYDELSEEDDEDSEESE